MRIKAIAIATAISAIAASVPVASAPLSVRETFRIGQGGTTFCSAQSLATDKGLAAMFDVGYSVTCRDAALPVGKIYKLRDTSGGARRLVQKADGIRATIVNGAVTLENGEPTGAFAGQVIKGPFAAQQ